MMNIKGVDISTYQKGLTISDIKAAGFNFAILRGGYTGWGFRTKHVDDTFEKFYAQAKEIGFPVGCYWYSCANTTQGGVNEANFLYDRCLKGRQFEYPIYIDVEDNHWQAKDKKGTTDAIIGFCSTLEAKGYYVGIYSNPDWFINHIETSRLTAYSKWLAYWIDEQPSFDVVEWQVWQNGSNAEIKGIKIDTDISLVDFPKVMKANGLNGYPKPVETPKKKSVDEIANEVIAGMWGAGAQRKKLLTEAGYNFDEVQDLVNKKLGAPTELKKTVDEIAKEVIAGKWGSGAERKKKLAAAGYNYDEVQSRVDELMNPKPKKKTVDQIAKEVIAGKWGAGAQRKKLLTEAGYNYKDVQARVNELLSK